MRAVFFDRDGVLNEAVVKDGRPHPPAHVGELRIDAEALDQLTRLRNRGFSIVVVTNQPDVARGTTTRDRVEAIHDRLLAELPLDAIYTCYHDNADRCACRKPKPGMFIDAARVHGIELSRSYMVGDRWGDIAAGREARCKTIWIERGYDEVKPQNADANVTSLAEACNWILHDCDRI